MNFKKNSLFLICALLLFGCGQGAKLPWQSSDIRPEKSLAALESCKTLSIPRDVALTGHFLYNYPRCMEDEQSKQLAPLIEASDLMGGLDALEQTASVLRFEIQSQSVNTRPVTKLLAAATDPQERDLWQSLETLADVVRPHALLSFLYGQANHNRLTVWAEKIRPLLSVESWPLIAGELRAGLEDSDYRSRVISFMKNFFSYPSYSELSQWLRPTQSKRLFRDSETAILRSWLDPLPSGETPVLGSFSPNENDEAKSGAGRFEEMWTALSTQEQQQVQSVFAGLNEQMATWPSSDRKQIFERTFTSMDKVFNRQGNPLGQAMALIDLMTTTSLDDIYPLFKALEDLLEQPSAVVPLNKKVASHELTQMLQKAFEHQWPGPMEFSGVQLNLCSGLDWAPIDWTADASEIQRAIIRWYQPDENCPSHVSPLSYIINQYIDKKIECLAVTKSSGDPDRFCLNPADLETLATNESVYAPKMESTLNSDQASEQRLELLIYIWQKVGDQLEHNVWALNSLNLSVGPVTAQQWQAMGEQVTSTQGEIKALAELENQWNQSKTVMVTNFLEKLSAYYLNALEAQLASTETFWGDGQDSQVWRSYFGMTAGGVLDERVGTLMYVDRLPEEIKNTFPGPERELKELLSRWAVGGALWKNYQLSADDGDVDFRPLGLGKTAVYYKLQQNVPFVGVQFGKTPLKKENVFQLDKGGPGRLGQLLNNVLNSRDIPGDGQSANLTQAWLSSTLLPVLDSDSFWADNLSFEWTVPPSFLLNSSSQEVTTNDFRASLFLLLRSFYVAPGFLPTSGSFAFASTDVLKKQFGSWSAPKGQVSQYRRLFPVTTSSGSEAQTPTEIFENVWQIHSWLDYQKLFDHKAWTTPLSLDNSAKLLGSLHLLTSNDVSIPQPAIGDRKWCWNGSEGAEDCPIVLTAESDEQKFVELNSFVRKNFMLTFCPLLSADLDTNDLRAKIATSAKLNLDDPELQTVCSDPSANLLTQAFDFRGNKKVVVYEKKNWIPLRLPLLSLYRNFLLGDKPNLPRVLQSLSFDLGMERSKNSGERLEAAVIPEHIFTPVRIPMAEARLQRLIAEHQGFYVGQSDFLGSLLTYQSSVFPDAALWQNRLNRLGGGAKLGDDPNKGKVYQLIYTLLLNPVKQAQGQGKSSLYLALKIGQELAQHQENIPILLALVDRQNDFEALESFSKAIALYIRSFDFDFNWSRTDLFVVKQILHRDLQRTVTDVLESFTTSQLDLILHAAAQAGAKLDPEIARPWEKLANFMRSQSFSGEQELFVLQGQKVLKALMTDTPLGISLSEDFSALLPILSSSRVDFSQSAGPSGEDKWQKLMALGFNQAPSLLKEYANSLAPEDFVRQIGEQLITPLDKPELASKLQDVATFFERNDLPLMSYAWSELLADPHWTVPMEKTFQAMDKISGTLAVKAAESMMNLLLRTKKVLVFLQSKLQWSDQMPSEVLRAFDHLVWLSSDGSSMLESQINVIKKWGNGSFPFAPVEVQQH